MNDPNVSYNEREIVSQILMDILESGSYNNIALRQTLDSKGDSLNSHQRGFITEVVNGVLRNFFLIDHMINSISNLQTGKMNPYIRNCLRSAVYQLKFMNNPKNFAVCNETVLLIKKRKMEGLSGFVNGILRNLLREKDCFNLPNEEAEPVKFLSIRYSIPQWLALMWVNEYGYDRTKQMLEISNTPPNVTVCVNTLKTDRESLMRRLSSESVGVEEGRACQFAVRLSGGAGIGQLPAFLEGEFHVIDESAMLAVIALDPKPGDYVLDLCAAPGGKAFMAAYLMGNKGEITANDIHQHKIKLIQDGASRLKLGIMKTAISDATRENPAFVNKYNKVLVDAPCTGYGVIRKKPDIKLSRTENSQKELAQLQKDILSNAAKYVKDGGTLVYSTCTLTNDENGDNAKWFAEDHPFTLQSERTVLPQEYGSDGFYIAVFTKKKG